MPEFDRDTLAFTDDAYDRENASEGGSRYGSYLRLNANLLHEDGDPLTAREFARAAWLIATSPVMSPGYVRTRPDLRDLTLVTVGEDYDRLALRIELPLRHDVLAHRPAGQPADWERDPYDRGTSRWARLAEPAAGRRPALLLSATLLVPVPEDILITPTTARPGPVMTREAKLAVGLLATFANTNAHLVGGLTGGRR
ncbi:hypothetical protein [Kitasatospora sp. NBC_00315]|uniref:hypothetical protein n=1 Tax=Kitasatospora sp. NBC_00315 TaxID=2975963 RepID=UPI00324F16E8